MSGKRGSPKTGFKVPPSLQKQILEVYRKEGLAAAQALVAPYGVCDRYITNMASVYGIRRGKNGAYDRDDPRWAWAKERGPVLAP